MMPEVTIKGLSVADFSPGRLEQRLIHLLRSEGCREGLELSVLITDDFHIAILHKQYMNLDGPTDVLSFEQDGPEGDPAQGGALGDVVISVDTARNQAQHYGIPLEAEMTLLAVHGALHLLGYNDIESADREVMRQKEKLYVPEAFPTVEDAGA